MKRKKYVQKHIEFPTRKRRGILKSNDQTQETNRSASCSSQEDVDLGKEAATEGGSSFFGCYLLKSLSPRFKDCTYIGFTVNPRRRIRQHNGEITSGASRTRTKRPWEMVLCIYGFPTNVSALQFEWAWQHPRGSKGVRDAAASFKTLGGVASNIKLAYTMLTLPAWQRLNLTVNFFSTKYTKHTSSCPTLPKQMKVRVCSMDDLPCYSGISWDSCEHDDYGDDEDLGLEGSVVESTSSHDSNDDKESSIEETATEKTNSLEQEIIEKHKWDQETERIEHSSFTDFSWASLSPFDVTEDELIFIEDSDPKFRNQNNKSAEAIVTDEYPSSVAPHQTCEVEIIDICTHHPSSDATEDELRFIEDSDLKFQQQNNKSREAIVTDEYPSSVAPHQTCEVEVIDISTPPPPRIRSSVDKKRTTSTAWPELIDLTDSTIFV